jgi:hypothetical protein
MYSLVTFFDKEFYMFEVIGILFITWVCWLIFKRLVVRGLNRTLGKATIFAESLGVQKAFADGMVQNPTKIISIRTKLADKKKDFAVLDAYKQYGYVIKSIDDFMTNLAIFKSQYKYVVDMLDPEGSETISERALDNYLAEAHTAEEHKASEFYLNAFTGAVFELFAHRHITNELSEQLLFQTNNFLQAQPQYDTALARLLTEKWKVMLKT